MKNQIIILATIIFTTIHPLFCMESAQQIELNKALFATIKSKRFFSIMPEVQRLLDAGANPNAREEIDLEAEIQANLDAGYDAMTQEEINQLSLTKTPLHYAALHGHEAACKLLLKRHANIHATTSFGETPLIFAVRYPSISKLFIEHGAQVNARYLCNRTPLFDAARTNAETCKLLLEYHADPTIRFTGLDGGTCLINAAYHYRTAYKNTCIAIVSTQARINTAIRITLLCLNRLRNDPKIGVLYHQFKILLLPHMGLYIPLNRLLNMRNDKCKRAYDYLKIPCLDPENIDAIYAQNDTTEQDGQGWSPNCSIQ